MNFETLKPLLDELASKLEYYSGSCNNIQNNFHVLFYHGNIKSNNTEFIGLSTLKEMLLEHNLTVEEFIESLRDYETVQTTGGGEGEGEYQDYVIYLKNYNIFILQTGHYNSWDSDDWYDYKQVFPVPFIGVKYSAIPNNVSIGTCIESLNEIFKTI